MHRNVRDRSTLAAFFVAVGLVAVLLVGSMWAGPAGAQDDGTPGPATPEGTPEATPVVTFTPEEARFARLGGMLADVIAEYGPPDWTDEGLVGYNSRSLGGVDTITMVFYDAAERVRSYMLVYLERPAELEGQEQIAAVVADVAPRDGICETEADDDNLLGEEVFVCASEGLKGVFTSEDLQGFEVAGEDGEYNYAVNPTDDAYFEIVVRLGSDGIPGPPTPVPTPAPTARPPLSDAFPPVEDTESLIDGSIEAGTPLSVTGTVLDIRLTDAGTTMVLDVAGEDGSVTVLAENLDDLAGVFVGETWTVYGVYTGSDCSDGCVAFIQVVKLG